MTARAGRPRARAAPSDGARSEQQGQHGAIALAFEGHGVGRVQELARLLATEPVPCPHALLLDPGHASDQGRELRGEQVVVGHLPGQRADGERRKLMVAGARPSLSNQARPALALRQGIWRKGDPHWAICGIPEVLYTDNGADFTSKHIEQVAVDLKMRLVFSTPGQLRGRGRIERFFRTVNQMFLCDLDGYIARFGRASSLTLDQLDRLFRAFLLETYHRRPSSEGKPSPKERWERGGFLPRMPESLDQLDILLIHGIAKRPTRVDAKARLDSLRVRDEA